MLFEASSLLVWRLWMLFLTELKPARFTVHNDLYYLLAIYWEAGTNISYLLL